MNQKLYWKNRIPFLIVNLTGMTALSLFLRLNGNTADSICLILFVWSIIVGAGLLLDYQKKKQTLDEMLQMVEELDERFLAAEILPLPGSAEGHVFYQILKMAEKSMLESIAKIKKERLEYKEYIEQWVHEMKTPITAMKLICENHRSELTKELLPELEKTNRFTEQALYYARSSHTEKDYSVREISLIEVIHQAIADNKYLLLQNQIRIEVAEEDCLIYSDEKWIRFILNQLIANAVKYRRENPVLKFEMKKHGEQVHLIISDNGIGISASDLPKIFEKGFTGKNGRNGANATGIGLYLCRKLCDKLGISLRAESTEGVGTAFSLIFYINHFIYQVEHCISSD